MNNNKQKFRHSAPAKRQSIFNSINKNNVSLKIEEKIDNNVNLNIKDKKNLGNLEIIYSKSSNSNNFTDSEIINLNIGGMLYETTKTTLLSNNKSFFVPLIKGDFGSLKDANGALFIDRNGKAFGPILEYLRHGTLIIPNDISIEVVYIESNFYGIDLLPGLCGDVKQGLYTSNNWILFFERDPDHPWIFGITGK